MTNLYRASGNEPETEGVAERRFRCDGEGCCYARPFEVDGDDAVQLRLMCGRRPSDGLPERCPDRHAITPASGKPGLGDGIVRRLRVLTIAAFVAQALAVVGATSAVGVADHAGAIATVMARSRDAVGLSLASVRILTRRIQDDGEQAAGLRIVVQEQRDEALVDAAEVATRTQRVLRVRVAADESALAVRRFWYTACRFAKRAALEHEAWAQRSPRAGELESARAALRVAEQREQDARRASIGAAEELRRSQTALAELSGPASRPQSNPDGMMIITATTQQVDGTEVRSVAEVGR